VGYTKPTKIQAETLRHALKDEDLLCLSETGSGKTLSFVLPILNYIRTTFAPG
jgi:superfamily II DNA/RNA helicase